MISVNKTLDKQPTIFLIPANQIIPWAIIFLLTFYICYQFLQLNFVWTILMTGWGCSTWWILTINGYHHFFSRLMKTPNWVRAITYYEPLINDDESK
jgi:hypothetical protein